MSTNIGQTEERGSLSKDTSFVERLSDKVGRTAGSSTTFGEPVERDGVTVIPVGKARWGVGGGEGSGKSQDEGAVGSGNGGGGGAMVTPVGYIEVREGRARFKPIYDLSLVLPALIGVGIIVALTLRGVRRLVRA